MRTLIGLLVLGMIACNQAEFDLPDDLGAEENVPGSGVAYAQKSVVFLMLGEDHWGRVVVNASWDDVYPLLDDAYDAAIKTRPLEVALEKSCKLFGDPVSIPFMASLRAVGYTADFTGRGYEDLLAAWMWYIRVGNPGIEMYTTGIVGRLEPGNSEYGLCPQFDDLEPGQKRL